MSQSKSKASSSSSSAAVALGLGLAAATVETAVANVKPEQGNAPVMDGAISMVGDVALPDPVEPEVLTQVNDLSTSIDQLVESDLPEVSADFLEQVALLETDFQSLTPEPELLQALADTEIFQLAKAEIVETSDASSAVMGADSVGEIAVAAGAESSIALYPTIAGGVIGAGGIGAIINNNDKTTGSDDS